jgi:hypothetical protein
MMTTTEMTMTSDAPQRMACAVGRSLEVEHDDAAPPRMTMLREIVHEHVHVTRARPEDAEDSLDPAARLRRAVHEAVAAARRRPE